MMRKGFTLVEVTLVLAAAGIMAAVALGARKRMIQWSYAKQTVRDMVAIRNAGQNYYWKNGSFPSALSDLSGYLSPDLISSPTNPYGYSYTITGSGLRFQVTTTIPKSAFNPGTNQVNRTSGSTNDTLETSDVVIMENTGGVIYEKDRGWAE
ncbi:MAG: prepilin-type N-terminal cleavage/methylation domain-containing protein [Candidatus Binatia bacterium]